MWRISFHIKQCKPLSVLKLDSRQVDHRRCLWKDVSVKSKKDKIITSNLNEYYGSETALDFLRELENPNLVNSEINLLPMDEILSLAKQEPTPLTLQQIKSFSLHGRGLRLKSAQFLHRELQIRFARAIADLSSLPIELTTSPHIKSAINKYRCYISSIQRMKVPTTEEEDAEFTAVIRQCKSDASNLVPLICKGLYDFKNSDIGKTALNLEAAQVDLTKQLDSFFLSRIGIRMLIGQHAESKTKEGGRVQLCNVKKIVEEAACHSKALCERYYGKSPEVIIKVANGKDSPFTYVKSHLHHMVFELLKNSMRASVEMKLGSLDECASPIKKIKPVMNVNSPLLGFNIPQDVDSGVTIYSARNFRCGDLPPPIIVVISQGHEDVTIKISDTAGGIVRRDWPKLWQYTYSTSTLHEAFEDHIFVDHFSGGGYGLPIARLFARYFGGDITLLSLEGYGTDAYLQAHKLGKKTEVIPGVGDHLVDSLYY